jgi:hypothetical protein
MATDLAPSVRADARLTLKDLDWLRRLRAAGDAGRKPPQLPPEIAAKLCAFGCAAQDERGPAITERGRGALLEQDMRDAEER